MGGTGHGAGPIAAVAAIQMWIRSGRFGSEKARAKGPQAAMNPASSRGRSAGRSGYWWRTMRASSVGQWRRSPSARLARRPMAGGSHSPARKAAATAAATCSRRF
jgi:hypothetical protein